MLNIDELVQVWQAYFKANDWQQLIHGITAKVSGCGLIYELGNPLGRQDEDCSIADMRNILFAEPHYHPAPSLEIYIVLQGSATVVLGEQQKSLKTDSVIVIPPNTAHYTIPNDLVLAVINTPPFREDYYMSLKANNAAVGFNYEQFKKLTN